MHCISVCVYIYINLFSAYLLKVEIISERFNKFIRNAMPSTRSFHKVSFRKTATLHLLPILEDKWVYKCGPSRRPCAVYHSSQHPGVTRYVYVGPCSRHARELQERFHSLGMRWTHFASRDRGNWTFTATAETLTAAMDGRGLCIAFASTRPRVPLFSPVVIKCARIRWNRSSRPARNSNGQRKSSARF